MPPKKLNWIVFSGIWVFPLTFGITRLCYHAVHTVFKHTEGYTILSYIRMAGVALVPVAILFLYNIYSLFTLTRTDFTFKGLFMKSNRSRSKNKAMYPLVDQQYLSDIPDGLILGKARNKYVRIPVDPYNVLHGLIIGPPGSGKSSGPLLCSLIANYMQTPAPVTVFALDIKPELAQKSVIIDGNPLVHVLRPDDHNSWGWDVYYGLNDYSSDDDILDRLRIIANSVIIGDRTSPMFFLDVARNLLCGMLLYYFHRGIGFIDTIQIIINNEVSLHVANILEDTNNCPPDCRAFSLLNRYNGLAGDAWDNIAMYLQNPLQVFLWADMQFLFRDNLRKADPRDLDQGISIFLSFQESTLKNYRRVLNMITAQVLDYLQGPCPSSRRMIYLIIDEFARIGRLDILDSLATLRSRQVSVVLAVQDLSQLRTIYSRDESMTIFNLCKVLCILDCQDLDTCRMVSAMTGTYQEETISYTSEPFNHRGRTTYGTRENNIVDIADIQTLSTLKEVIIIVEGKYYRIQKAFYKTDPILGPQHELIAQYNGIANTL